MSDPTRRDNPDEGFDRDEGQQGDRGAGREQNYPPDRKEGQPGGSPSRDNPGRGKDQGMEGEGSGSENR